MSKLNHFGPIIWTVFNEIVRIYPETVTETIKYDYKKFFHDIVQFVPCKRCRDHYALKMVHTDWKHVLLSRENISQFVIDLHNSVNARLKKKILTTEEAMIIINEPKHIPRDIIKNNLRSRLYPIIFRFNEMYPFLE